MSDKILTSPVSQDLLDAPKLEAPRVSIMIGPEVSQHTVGFQTFFNIICKFSYPYCYKSAIIFNALTICLPLRSVSQLQRACPQPGRLSMSSQHGSTPASQQETLFNPTHCKPAFAEQNCDWAFGVASCCMFIADFHVPTLACPSEHSCLLVTPTLACLSDHPCLLLAPTLACPSDYPVFKNEKQ